MQLDSPAFGYGCQSFGGLKQHFSSNEKLKTNSLEPKQRSIFVGGTVSEDAFWNADSIFVTDNVHILNGVKVTIAEGAVVSFLGYFGMIIEGCLEAIGTAGNKIHFTSAEPEFFAWDESEAGAWNQIVFLETAATNEKSRFHYCVFEYSKAFGDNQFTHEAAGGVFYILNTSNVEIENSVFHHNFADLGGAIACFFNANPVISNSLFYDNKAIIAGASLYHSDSYPVLINNTITANETMNSDSFFATGSIHNFCSKPTLFNNIIHLNSTHYFENLEVCEQKLFYTFTNNIGNYYTENDNIISDPLFTDFFNQQYDLSSDSPCINSGMNIENYVFPPYDLAGNDRISGNIIDMGAFEYQIGTVSPQDIMPVSAITMQLFPNPFNPKTTIAFDSGQLKHNEPVTIKIFNSKGQNIRELNTFYSKSGDNEVVWHGKNQYGATVPSGVYLFLLQVDGFADVMIKGILLK